MIDHIRSRRAPLLALTATVALAACGGDRAGGDTAVRTDSAAPQFGDTSLAPATPATTVDSTPVAGVDGAAPAVPDTQQSAVPAPARPAPARPAPAPARPAARPAPSGGAGVAPAPAPAERRGTIGSGTTLRLSLGEKVCSRTLSEGERVTATLADGVEGSNGARIPSGSRVTLVVTRSTSAKNNDMPELAFRTASVRVGDESYELDGRVSVDSLAIERQGGDGKKVAIGAAAGAVLGNVIGGGNRAVRTAAGAAAGGLAGAAVAAATGDRYACVPAGRFLTARTTAPVSVVVP